MDPKQAMIETLHALHQGDVVEAIEQLSDLAEWMEKGGAAPDFMDAFRAFGADACLSVEEVFGNRK